MCGIAGLVAHNNYSRLASDIKKFTECLEHRGPDNDGFFIDHMNGIALGHRRLSILDLSKSGNQPMKTQSGRYIIIYNGEVYNHQSLRAKLDFSSWKGSSDTETILQAFREWGFETTLKQLNGMFAIALYDKREKRLYLARDRMGIKPLYYGKNSKGIFVFASELKSIITTDIWEAKVDKEVLPDYFRYGFIPAPDSILKDIYKLQPGHFLIYDIEHSNIQTISAFWSFDDTVQAGLSNAANNSDIETNLKKLDELLSDSVQKRMLSDVPLGAFLSGGIDSSVITAMMQEYSQDTVDTYSIGFDDEDYDESVYAEAVAEYLGTNHTTRILSKEDSLDIIPKLPQMYDEPFGDSSQVPTHLVSQLAAEHVKVLLSGDGADELFAGYNRHFMASRVWNNLNKVPSAIRDMAGWMGSKISPNKQKKLVNFVYPNSRNIPHLSAKLEKLNRMIPARSFEELYGELVITSPAYSSVLNIDGKNKTNGNDIDFSDPRAYFVYQDTIRALPDDMLVKVDRASMACSLEARVPFLDHRLVEYSWQIPIDQKIRNGEGKWILKQLAYQYIPKRLLDRPKTGFEVPIAEWLCNELKGWAEELLFDSTSIEKEIWNNKGITNIWNEHQRNEKNHKDLIWSLLMFRAWENEYIEYLT